MNDRTEVTKTGIFWIHFSAGDRLPLSDDFELNFDEQCHLPVLLIGDAQQHYNENGKVSITAHTILMGILLGYEELIPGTSESAGCSGILSRSLRKLVKGYFGKDDIATFLLGAAHWLRENAGLRYARKAIWTAMQLEPFAASIRNDYIGILWHTAENETSPVALSKLLQELVDAYCHQFFNEVGPVNLEMSSYFFCCSLGILQLIEQPAEREWYKCAFRNIADEYLVEKLKESEETGFSMQLCSLALSRPGPEGQRMNYGPYWYALIGDDFHDFIETGLCNPDKSWSLLRHRPVML